MVLLLLIMIENGEMIYIKNIISKRCFYEEMVNSVFIRSYDHVGGM